MKLKSFITIASVSLLLSSCLKSENTIGLIEDKGSIVSEISDVSYYGDVKVLSLNAVPATETVVGLTLKFYAPRSVKPANDITLHLTMNNSLATGLGLTIPSSAAIVLPSLDVVIPKTSGVAEMNFTINKNQLDLSKQYGLGFDLTTASEGVVSELGKQIVVAFIIKNAYDADYTTTGFFFHPAAPRPLDATKHLTTLGAATCGTYQGDLSGFTFTFDVSGSNLTNYVAVGAPGPSNGGSSGFMTADNPGGVDYSSSAPNATGTNPWTITNYNNTYNAATKTFFMHYGYRAGVTGSQNIYTRQVYEKWVRQ